jgi:hypothetical protein
VSLKTAEAALKKRKEHWLKKLRSIQIVTSEIPFPEQFVDFLQYCHVPHKEEPGRLICLGDNLNSDQIKMLDLAAFRDPIDGKLQPGRSIHMKSRQIGATTLGECKGLHLAGSVPGLRGMLALHKREGGILEAIRDLLWLIILGDPETGAGGLPEGWLPVISPRGAETVKFANRSRFVILVTGQSIRQSTAQGRSQPAHWIHGSEAAWWAYASEFYQAAKGSQSLRVSSAYIESTPSYPDAWFHRVFNRTQQGESEFDDWLFSAWYTASDKVVDPDSETGRRMLAMEVSPDVREQEEALNLSPGQIAWRRLHFVAAEPEARALAKRENPESPSSCYGGEQSHFDAGALAKIEDALRPPERTIEVSEDMVVWIYRKDVGIASGVYSEPLRAILIGSDQAGRKSETDHSATAFLDYHTRDLIAVLWGNAWPHQIAEGILLALEALRVVQQDDEKGWVKGSRYIPVKHSIEINKDFGLVEACSVHKRLVPLLMYRGRYGVNVTTHLRNKLLTHLGKWIEGSGVIKRPQADLPCRQLLTELEHFIDRDGKVQHDVGYNDDILLASSHALFLKTLWRLPGDTQRRIAQPDPEPLDDGPRAFR